MSPRRRPRYHAWRPLRACAALLGWWALVPLTLIAVARLVYLAALADHDTSRVVVERSVVSARPLTTRAA